MLLNFKSQFVPKILAGEKTHTIRATRKIQPKVGETCHLYTGLRQKNAKLLGRFPCVKVEHIEITDQQYILIDGVEIEADEKEALARRDGFHNFTDMMSFWDGRLPFKGQIIHWRHNAHTS